MAAQTNDTIFAAASGHGRAAICVIRTSGPRSRFILETMAGAVPPPRRLVLRTLHGADADILDQALVAFMPAPRTYTGEDQAELHIHGGLATRQAVLRALAALAGCRAAEPGEFTRRAFLNGRLDLSRAEGLADLIDAETEAQRRQAMRQLEGALGNKAEHWRESLLDELALAEATLDFADEADVPDALGAEAVARIARMRDEMAGVLARPGGERLRDGFTAVLAGAPNAGKSTLLNTIAGRDVAIVSPLAGTTRDAIEVRCDLGGLPVTLVDTAGLRESQEAIEDAIEREGVARTVARARSADLVLWLVAPDGTVPHGSVAPDGTAARAFDGAPILMVGTKSDLGCTWPGAIDVAVSARTGAGLPALLESIRNAAERTFGLGDPIITRERHRAALVDAEAALGRAIDPLGVAPTELVAEELRLAARAIGRISGRVDVDDVLDRLFSAFCIGK
jgi:tRNA modification GTPase